MTDRDAVSQRTIRCPSLPGCNDPGRSAEDNAGPHIIVVDDFYDDPHAVRSGALSADYVVYAPPSRWALEPKRRPACEWSESGLWLSSSLASFHGKPAHIRFDGYRFNPDWLRRDFEDLTGDKISREDWEPGGDRWNGAFHLRDASHTSGAVHHHFHESALPHRGWSGVVFLTPNAPARSGTSFYRDRATGRCVAGKGELFDFERDRYELVLRIENLFNRLVLFRENVLHYAEPGFGEGENRRLTQTFFFSTLRLGISAASDQGVEQI